MKALRFLATEVARATSSAAAEAALQSAGGSVPKLARTATQTLGRNEILEVVLIVLVINLLMLTVMLTLLVLGKLLPGTTKPPRSGRRGSKKRPGTGGWWERGGRQKTCTPGRPARLASHGERPTA